MAFVLAQHLDPSHRSLLPEILSKATQMPVSQVSDGTVMTPNRIYVMPPNVEMVARGGTLHLLHPREPRGQRMPIDAFLRSLAEDRKSGAIGVILSGTASDGVLGLTAIKAEGGITFAQDEKSARYGSMPHGAVAAGVVDFVLPPEKIAHELARIGRHPYVQWAPTLLEDSLPMSETALDRIFLTVRAATGVDFSHYKQTTIKRRIKRRMTVHKLERPEDYLTYIQSHPDEVRALHDDILIKVTGFFREAETFEALKDVTFPAILRRQPPGSPIRIWVPGCSTGEEAYSIGMCLLEFLAEKGAGFPVQIFATDVSDSAIAVARSGVYRESIALDVSVERLGRFFVKVDRGYQVSRSIRDLCVFTRQDVTNDPPFSRLDLIRCRNVLIYLGPVLQKQVVGIFHYSLNPGGFLQLGSSENVGAFSGLFSQVDRRHRIFAKRPAVARRQEQSEIESRPSPGEVPREKPLLAEALDGVDVQREADRILLTRYAPSGVIVNDEMQILQFRGQLAPYLELAPGPASLNLLRMARKGLAPELRNAIEKAKRRGEPVRRDRIPLGNDERPRTLGLEVIPLMRRRGGERFFLVLFEEAPHTPAPAPSAPAPAGRERAPGLRRELTQLRKELDSTSEYLKTLIEEHDATTQELKAANEELLSGNEELQSTNEELETSKEELQSTNEELTTLNEELQNRNLELSQLNNDLVNVFESVNIPIVILGADLRIRRFTPKAEELLNLIPTDAGRRITDINPNIDLPDLEKLLREVIETAVARERTVADHHGHRHSMRVRPYRVDNKVEGAVLTLLDVDALLRSLEQLQRSQEYAQAIVETVNEGLVVLDERLRVRRASGSFHDMFGLVPGETEGRPLGDLGKGEFNDPRLLQLLRETIAGGTRADRLKIDLSVAGERRIIQFLARRLRQDAGGPDRGSAPSEMALLAVEDITRREETERALHELSGRLLHLRDEEQRRIARELHDSTAQKVSALAMNLAVLDRISGALGTEERRALAESLALADECSRELRDLASLLHPPLLDDVGLESALQWYADSFGRLTGIMVSMDISPRLVRLGREIETTIFRIVQECLNNIQHHSGSKTAAIRIHTSDGVVTVEVADHGRGIPAEFARGAGPGVGIPGMRGRVQQLGGQFEIT